MSDAQPLTPEEARTLTDEIKAHAEKLYELLLTAHEREAWRALRYESWRAYATAEFGMSQARMYDLLAHGRVVRELETADSSMLEKLNARQSSELIKVPAGQRADVWEAALDATDGKPTALSVADAAKAYRQRNGEPTQTPMDDAARARSARRSFQRCLLSVRHAVDDIRGGVSPSDADELRSEIRAIRDLLDQIEGEI